MTDFGSFDLKPRQRLRVIEGEWKPANTEQAEARLHRSGRGRLRTEEEEQYLEDYVRQAHMIHGRIKLDGWARAKGFYKKLIRELIFEGGPVNDGSTDAILDNMGC